MRSIRLSLVAMLVAAFTLVSFMAALLGYRASMDKAEQLLDTQLRYAVDILRYASGGAASTAQHDASAGLAFQVWHDGVLVLDSGDSAGEAIAPFRAGYDYVNFAGFRWRSLSEPGTDGTWYQVAERADQRYTLAEQVVMQSILPLLTWLPVAAVLIWFLVGWGLAPLRALSAQINRKASDDLGPLAFDAPPAELRPVVASTNALLGRLSSALQRERDFAAHAAHELRTPISGLKIHLHNLAPALPPGHASLTHLRADVERMQHLVEQVLDLARTQPELMRVQFAPVDLHALAERVAASLWPDFSEAGVSLSLSGDACQVAGDEGMLETLLRNLLDNARKYAGRDSEVEVVTALSVEHASIAVRDTGPGIPAAEQERVLQRFYRARAADSSGASGSGLGLAIVVQIAQLHGADVSLSAGDDGRGLAVTIRFPRGDLA